MTAAGHVTVVEVGPRDGLQNEKGFVPTDEKVSFVEALADAGLSVVETTAFVSPRAIPQLADSFEVFSRVTRKAGVRYPVLVPNEKGLLRALSAGVREIALFTAATDTFNLRNTNATIEESFARFVPVLVRARAEGLWVRGYVSTVFGCPYEGRVDPAKGVAVAMRLLAAGCEEVSLGDTIGVAVPTQVADIVGRLLQAGVPAARIALHMHDTRGTALANVVEGLRAGIRVFDSAAGGLGGCPYAPGASGNLATEDLLYLLHGMGYETGVDLAKVARASQVLAERIGHAPPSRVLAALRGTSDRGLTGRSRVDPSLSGT